MDNLLDKYTDDDIDYSEEKLCPPKRGEGKIKKPEIKTRNKMFSDFNF